MKVETDLEETFEAVCLEIKNKTYNRPDKNELAKMIERLFECGADSYSAEAEILFLVCGKNETVKEELTGLLTAPDPRDALIEKMGEAVNKIDAWLVCAAIATPEDMAKSFAEMQKLSGDASTAWHKFKEQ